MTEKKSLADSPRSRKAVIAFVAVMFVLMIVALLRTDLTPEDTRHDHFVAALWPPSKEPGKFLRFEREKAVLYRDPLRPLTWHVCTATVCGRFFEAEGDEEKSK